jgi:hypothetical protein
VGRLQQEYGELRERGLAIALRVAKLPEEKVVNQVATDQRSAVQCSAVQCSAVQCSAVQCSAVQFCAVQCSAAQCSALHCTAPQVPHEVEVETEESSCHFCHAGLSTAQTRSLDPPSFIVTTLTSDQ